MNNIKRLLIANRGEIACRIIQTAKDMGITCIAVYSDADSESKHVALADEAYHIGGAKAIDSYLQAERIIQLAVQQQVDAIHPGYGFLSENPHFATACQNANIIFIGPSAQAITAMGSKDTAKDIMQQAGVPTVPGYQGKEQNADFLQQQAENIGYPVLLKAVAGGGGKGMRVVHRAEDFQTELAAAKREALASFANDQVLIEKYLLNPRHIEVQVFADSHGHVVHLFERDCSIQRRYQKVVEEAPAPNLSTKLRQDMTRAACAAAKAIHYTGAGTIEFLLANDNQFYFMEMNTRLQVEHPVTELITKQDLVAWQIIVAEGQALPLNQEQIEMNGAAIEVRIYAEDPYKAFLPAIGHIQYLQHDNIARIDSGIRQGDSVSPYYDPMIAKLIVWGDTRSAAVEQLQQSLAAYQLVGLTTNIPFLQAIIQQPAFNQGKYTTDFITEYEATLLTPPCLTDDDIILASQFMLQQQREQVDGNTDPWALADNWSLLQLAKHYLRFKYLEQVIIVEIELARNGCLLSIIRDNYTEQYWLEAASTTECDILQTHIIREQQQLYIFNHKQQLILDILDLNTQTHEIDSADKSLNAPMPGTIISILAAAEQTVTRGTPLLIMEAMKMEHTIKAPSDGTVTQFLFEVGAQVLEGDKLLEFTE